METETIIDAAESGWEEFEAAFSGEGGYQTEETASATEEETGSEEAAEETAKGGETGEEGSEEEPAEPENGGEEAPSEAQQGTFTLRVNKEDRTVSREEMISLAQKGADYDRVKGQLTERDNTITELRQTISQNQEALDLLEMISQETKIAVPELLDQLHVGLRRQKGETEAEAKANIRALKAERAAKTAQEQVKGQNAKPDGRTRAEKEVEEFRNRFPGVELTKELCGQIQEDVRKGMTISEAYSKHQMARKDAEIAELKRQMAAKQQNDKNRAKAVGSQKDSGGKRTKSAEDDFFAAFDK